MGKAYILEAAMNFAGLENVSDCPTKHVPPPEINNMTKETKLDYFHEFIGAFVDEFVTADPEKEMLSKQEKNTDDNMAFSKENDIGCHSEPDRIR